MYRDIGILIVRDIAKEHLLATGYCWHQEVMAEAGPRFEPYVDVFAWEATKDLLENDFGDETLIKVVKPDDGVDLAVEPEAMLPSFGRPTEGYARLGALPVEVVKEAAARRGLSMQGSHKSIERFASTCEKAGLSISFTPTAPPALSFTPSPAGE